MLSQALERKERRRRKRVESYDLDDDVDENG